MKRIIDKLAETNNLSDFELKTLIESDEFDQYLYSKADSIRQQIYGNEIFIRGLIEISNICKNDCFYCGIRGSNSNVKRYRLTPDEIIECCDEGYKAGFRTFVLQGGEDGFFTDEVLCALIKRIKNSYPDCAVTLSLGERSYESYKTLYEAGADRYLLRHETANGCHYRRLHPENLNPDFRKECLFNLKKIGYQTGSGFMVGSPYQTTENLIEDIRFLQALKPEMIGIGPFIPHHDTVFKDFKSGDLKLTLRLLSILRLIFPNALLPATTALGTIDPMGRELGILAGANVVMPNLSPVSSRKLYDLYDNKIHSGEESVEGKKSLEKRFEAIGYKIVTDRGDFARERGTVRTLKLI